MANSTSKIAPAGNLNILVVDDNPTYGAEIRTLLHSSYDKECRVTVKQITSLEKADSEYFSDLTRLEGFCLVLMDHDFGNDPNGRTGLGYLVDKYRVFQEKGQIPATQFVLISQHPEVRNDPVFRECNLRFVHKNDTKANIAYFLASELGLALCTRKRRLDTNDSNRCRAALEKLIVGAECRAAVEADILAATTNEDPILILGATGSGKELIADAVHKLGMRSNSGTMLKINCASLPPTLIHGELCGWVKGAFTGATSDKNGILQVSTTGDLFMDEIGDLDLEHQDILLRAIEYREVFKMGSTGPERINTRFILATNKEDIGSDSCPFRQDLFWRISANIIRVPPLNLRKRDIVELVNFLAHREFASDVPFQFDEFPQDCKDLLLNHTWPGNVRELRNVVIRLGSRILASLVKVAELNKAKLQEMLTVVVTEKAGSDKTAIKRRPAGPSGPQPHGSQVG